MKNERIDLGHVEIDVLKNGNLIYLNVYGEFTDDDVIAMTKYLENFFDEISGPTIRVWDSTNISSDQFKITAKGTDQFNQWSGRMKKKWPGNIAYLIADKPLSFGISRMYELKTSDHDLPIIVLRNFDKLPDNIKARIPRI
ncbi:MAG: hypothetical protein P8130_01930 [Deltaproteobacteria bacterium]